MSFVGAEERGEEGDERGAQEHAHSPPHIFCCGCANLALLLELEMVKLLWCFKLVRLMLMLLTNKICMHRKNQSKVKTELLVRKERDRERRVRREEK